MIYLLTMTLEGLRPCVMKVMMPWKVSITSKRIGNSHSLDALPTFESGMGLRVMKRTKRVTTWRAMMKAGVAASNPLVDVNTSSCITSGLHTSSDSSSVQKRQLGTANLR